MATSLPVGLVGLGLRVTEDVALTGSQQRRCGAGASFPNLATTVVMDHDLDAAAVTRLIVCMANLKEARLAIFTPVRFIVGGSTRPVSAG